VAGAGARHTAALAAARLPPIQPAGKPQAGGGTDDEE